LEGQVSTVVETNAQLQQEQQAQRDELSFLSDELISLRQTQSGENLINKWVTLLHAYILVLCSLHQTQNMWNYNSDLCGQWTPPSSTPISMQENWHQRDLLRSLV